MFNEFREALLVLISTPVYAIVIGAEIIFSNIETYGPIPV